MPRKIGHWTVHPYCDLFPDITAEEFDELADDIAKRGLDDPIIRFGGQVIDGKNRLAACLTVGITPVFRDWVPKNRHDENAELLEFVVARNLKRRHLTVGQRAMIAAEVHKFHETHKQPLAQICASELRCEKPPAVSMDEAAEAMRVSPRSVQMAETVLEHAVPEVVQAVKHGQASLNDACAVARHAPEEQRRAVEAVQAGKTATMAAATRDPVLDSLGRQVHAPLVEIFADCRKFRGIIMQLGKIQAAVEELSASKSGAWIPVQECRTTIEELKRQIKFSMPFTECPKCRRLPTESCKVCRGSGWCTETAYSRARTGDDERWLNNRS